MNQTNAVVLFSRGSPRCLPSRSPLRVRPSLRLTPRLRLTLRRPFRPAQSNDRKTRGGGRTLTGALVFDDNRQSRSLR